MSPSLRDRAVGTGGSGGQGAWVGLAFPDLATSVNPKSTRELRGQIMPDWIFRPSYNPEGKVHGVGCCLCLVRNGQP